MTNPNNLPIRSVAITGGLGNLGTKLFRHLAALETVHRLVGLDVKPAGPDHAASLLTGIPNPPTLEFVTCDLADYQDRRWRDIVEQVDAVVHFAAQNPYPEAS